MIEEILQERNNLLVILNTKKAVLELYQLLAEQSSEEIELYHLSTAMCPAHRKQILKEINVKLNAKNQQRKLVCITTQLIEAGIDISFEAVIRSSAGLDSIAQAAGRCNRNGEQPNKQPVYIIRLEKN
nr:helicase-related protein [Melissococcus plutonius]